MKKMIEEQSKACCKTYPKSLNDPTFYQTNNTSTKCGASTCGVPNEYVLGKPEFIDPLYRPYHTDYSKSPYKFPYVINTGYPLVDPYRRRMGWGQIFRSKQEGICPEGFRSAGRGLCIPLEPESWGMFYTNENTTTPLGYSNCKIPYNASPCEPCKYKYGPWTKTVCGGSDDEANREAQRILGANGYDDRERVRQANCVTENFW